jgi:hypothetical protein
MKESAFIIFLAMIGFSAVFSGSPRVLQDTASATEKSPQTADSSIVGRLTELQQEVNALKKSESEAKRRLNLYRYIAFTEGKDTPISQELKTDQALQGAVKGLTPSFEIEVKEGDVIAAHLSLQAVLNKQHDVLRANQKSVLFKARINSSNPDVLNSLNANSNALSQFSGNDLPRDWESLSGTFFFKAKGNGKVSLKLELMTNFDLPTNAITIAHATCFTLPVQEYEVAQ